MLTLFLHVDNFTVHRIQVAQMTDELFVHYRGFVCVLLNMLQFQSFWGSSMVLEVKQSIKSRVMR